MAWYMVVPSTSRKISILCAHTITSTMFSERHHPKGSTLGKFIYMKFKIRQILTTGIPDGVARGG